MKEHSSSWLPNYKSDAGVNKQKMDEYVTHLIILLKSILPTVLLWCRVMLSGWGVYCTFLHLTQMVF